VDSPEILLVARVIIHSDLEVRIPSLDLVLGDIEV
jgi:hypothetical protein